MTRHMRAALFGAFAVMIILALGHKSTRTPEPLKKAQTVTPTKVSKSVRLDQFWQRAKEEIYKSPEELQAQHTREIRKGQFYSKVMSGDPKVPEVALTFDDGPHPHYTPKILAILKRYNIKATFFVVGEMAQKYPWLIKDEYAAGDLIGNHTYHHVNLTKIPFVEVAIEWQANQDVIKSITGKDMKYCRPPGGDYDRHVINAAMDVGLTTVLWTDDPGDYASPGDKTIEVRTLDRVHNGGIILLHDGIQQTIDVLPQIIETLQRKGYKFVTVDQMDAQKSGQLQETRRAYNRT